jgi:hypothetical protein
MGGGSGMESGRDWDWGIGWREPEIEGWCGDRESLTLGSLGWREGEIEVGE